MRNSLFHNNGILTYIEILFRLFSRIDNETSDFSIFTVYLLEYSPRIEFLR